MYFTELILKNFGIYKGHQKIEFREATSGQNITLVGGLNGRGKTTLLEAVFLALFGKRAIRFLQDERISYNEYLRGHINKSALDQETSITLTIVCEDEAQSVLTVNRHWSLGPSGVNEGFIVLKQGREDKYLSENWDYYVEEILPLGIARFFFFDNEKIAQIADDDSFNKIKDSIKVLIGISTIERLIDDMKKLIKRKKGILEASSDAGLRMQAQALDDELNQLDEKMRQAVRHCGRIKRDLGYVKNRLEQREHDFWKHGGQLGLKREKIQEEKNLLLEKLRIERQKMIDMANTSTIPFLFCRPLLMRTFDHAQQDERIRSARYSTPLLTMLHQKLLSFTEEHMNSREEQQAFMSFITQEFAEITNIGQQGEIFTISPSTQVLFNNIISQSEQVREQARQLVQNAKDADNEILQLDMHLNFDVQAGDALDLMTSIKELTQQVGTLEANIRHEEEKQRALQMQMDAVEKQRWQLMRKELDNEQSNDEIGRMLKYASITLEVMSEFKKRLQHQRVKDLEQQIFNCFTFIAQKESIISKIIIDPETLDIKLMDYQGGELLKRQLSAGEKQIFAVSILWGLAKCSGYRLPVIVDTPLGRLDSKHRANFVQQYLPYASEQVIVLSTDEEIYGRYFSYVKPYINNVYTLQYDEVEKATSIIPGYFGGVQT